MSNPLFNNNTSPNGATAPNDSLNESYKRYKRGYNKFNLTRQFYNTERYADINLIECLEGVEGDKLPFGNKHQIRSYTLKSPIMFDIYKKKTYFMVDNKAILPNNWDKVYKQPNKGDDVDAKSVNCIIDLMNPLKAFMFQLANDAYESASSNNYNYLWRVLFFLESVFSNGSLLSSMNGHLSSIIKIVDSSNIELKSSFDQWLEETLGYFDGSSADFSNNLVVLFPSLSNQRFSVYQSPSSYITVSPCQIFDMMRTFPDFVVSFDNSESSIIRYNYLLSRLQMLSFRFDDFGDGYYDFNISRLIAYQLACVQFYTRDSVDNIYNAELFMQNAKSIARDIIYEYRGVRSWPTFEYNGVDTDYDVFSGEIFREILGAFFSDSAGLTQAKLNAYNFFHMIFFFRKSLRYGDYFVGAKTLPYAPLDVTADVVGSGVSALEITRSIVTQRFANAVERISNTMKDYLKLMDGVLPPSPLEPRFLASSTSTVGGFEVENTAQDQGNIVTILKSGNSNYVYEVEVGSPCIIIGVSTYEVPRVYSRTVDRFFFHKDRFDMFNKFFQNIGDQPISLGERSSAFNIARIFGYTPRHMEYKQRYPIASGGFVENLPGYAFITDNDQSGQNDTDFNNSGLEISSIYIRNRNSEFDRFYSSLTGLTLASYFHFICKYDCICHASRQMEYSPSIL